ncbi:MAG: 50S ribosomal protein L21 [Myxococcales bacterium]|nr:50S ribosomal protein L21 [Myxococcales bacterium]|tara:strand:+ start:330 stop:644 length:315 start_codon:yes stop_codon:yes gene_type:complete
MYAIIKTGGKQYRVSPGQTLRVEKLDGDVGETVELDNVLLVGGGEGIQIGTPSVAGAAVSAEIVEQGRAKKIIVFKKKRRKGYHKKQGHRQYYTGLRITDIRAS